MAWQYTLYALPVSGFNSAQTIAQMQGRLTETLDLLTGISACPAGLTVALQQALSNIRLHVVSGLGAIDAYLGVGHIDSEPALSVPDLQNAIDLQIVEINKTKPLWDKWYNDAVAQGTPADSLPVRVSPTLVASPTMAPIVAGGGSDTLASSLMSQPSLQDYAVTGVLAAAVLLVWRLLK